MKEKHIQSGANNNARKLAEDVRQLVSQLGRKLDGIWPCVDVMRGKRRVDEFPEWTFITQTEVRDIFGCVVGGDLELTNDLLMDIVLTQVFSAWRVTQGVYCFDEAIYEAVLNTEMGGPIPSEMLLRLPEWAVLVATPGMEVGGRKTNGFIACLDLDPRTLTPILILLGIEDRSVEATQIWLTPGGSLMDCIAHSVDLVRNSRNKVGEDTTVDMSFARAAVNLLLYICSQVSDVGIGSERPKNPTPKKIKNGARYFPPDKPKEWNVGVRMGAALRMAYEQASRDEGGEGGRVRPHIRRAHWHGFRSGPMKREDGTSIEARLRKFDLKWLPPIAVNVGDTELPAVIRPVK